MKCTSLAAVLAAPVLLAFPGTTHAHPPKHCFSPFGTWGICPGIFSKLHQHGPLFNYGPYYGYPPFEPYGYWNSYLHYNGPWGGGGFGGGHGHGHGHGYASYAGRGGICSGGGMHGSWLHGGWFHGDDCGKHGLFHGHKSWLHHGSSGGDCAGCAPTAFNPLTTDPASRYAGAGAAGHSAAHYSGLPTIHPTGIAPVGGFGR